MSNDKQVGVITEQGYFGEGYGFTEATEDDKKKLEESLNESSSDERK